MSTIRRTPLSGTSELVRRAHERVLDELQSVPIVNGVLLKEVELADGVITFIPHGLGREHQACVVSPPWNVSTVGCIDEVGRVSSTYDKRRYLVLRANGYGATVYVNIWVF